MSSLETIQQLLEDSDLLSGSSHHGFSSLEKPLTFEFYRQWIEKQYHGDMTYLEKHLSIKENPQLKWSMMKSAIVLAYPYHACEEKINSHLHISLYAQGKDYHIWIIEKLRAMIEKLQSLFPNEVFLPCTDSQPLMERDLAMRAGLGWVGKNTCLIHPKNGSLFFICEILTSLELSPKATLVHDFCGKCTRCIDICPTQAITRPRELDARKCIAYWTIESKQVPPVALREKFQDWFFGCDLCQTVCPWNKSIQWNHSEKSSLDNVINDLRFILNSSNKQLMKTYKDSPIARAGGWGLKRNALIVIANEKIVELQDDVKKYFEDEKLSELALWTWKKLFLLIMCFIIPWIYTNEVHATPIRIQHPSEPDSLDPQKLASGNSQYILPNIYRNLMIYSNDQLIPDLATKCTRVKPKVVRCYLRKNIKWSNGTPITGQDFLATYKRLLSPENNLPRPDLLFTVTNAQEFFLNKKKFSEVGFSVRTINGITSIEFHLKNHDPDFEFKLSNIILAPTKNIISDKGHIRDQLTTGPYLLSQWIPGQTIELKNNPFYWKAFKRPTVVFKFIQNPNVAINLYKMNEIDFVRNIPTSLIPFYINHEDFHWHPLYRFDYFGLKIPLNLRKKMTHSLNYEELQKIFQSPSRPGCFAIPENWVLTHTELCYQKTSASAAHDNLSTMTSSYDLYYSNLGGDDHRKTVEWLQSQWKEKIQLQINPQSVENKIFLNELKKNKYTLFRKGFPLERPTCLSAIEAFESNNPENYVQFNNITYDHIIRQFYDQQLSPRQQKKLCSQALKILLDESLIIPTGMIYFNSLYKISLGKIEINKMNHLNLELLHQP